MQGLKLGITAIGFLAAASANAAPYYLGTLAGNLVSYTATIPGEGTINGIFDPVSPAILGSLHVDFGYARPSIYLTSFKLPYLNIDLGDATKTLPTSEVYISNAFATTFNATSGHLVLNGGGVFQTKDAFCIGDLAICSPLFTEGNQQIGTYGASLGWRKSAFTGTLDLIFNTARTQFTGTFTEIDTLTSGAVITKVYSLTSNPPPPSPVPLPFAGLLFGSSLAALAGVARVRNRNPDQRRES